MTHSTGKQASEWAMRAANEIVEHAEQHRLSTDDARDIIDRHFPAYDEMKAALEAALPLVESLAGMMAGSRGESQPNSVAEQIRAALSKVSQ